MSELPAPLVSAEIDLRGFSGFMLDVDRLLASELVALGTPEECWAATMLWCRAWKQSPAASLPQDDRVLAAFSGAGKRWAKVKTMALRGFVKCSDGRLYHPVLAAEASKAWKKRQQYGADQERLKKWREGKKGTRPDGEKTPDETADETRFERVREPERQGQGQGQGQNKAAAQLRGGARDKRFEPHDEGPVAHSEAMQACVRAIGESHPADPVFGPIMLLIADGIPLAKITTVLRSEAETRRARSRPPIRTWSKWAEIVVERLAAAPKVVPQPSGSGESRVDLGGGFTMGETTLRSVIDSGQWLPQFGGRPGEASCKVPERFWPAAKVA